MADDEVDEIEEGEAVAGSTTRSPLVTLSTVEEFEATVLQCPEFLNVVFAVAIGGGGGGGGRGAPPPLPVCPFSAALGPVFAEMAAPRSATAHARFFRVDVLAAPALATRLGVSKTPSMFVFLKGTQRGATFVGSNPHLLRGHFRNALIRRNDEMRDFDEAKAAALQLAAEAAAEAAAAAAAAAEGEEGAGDGAGQDDEDEG